MGYKAKYKALLKKHKTLRGNYNNLEKELEKYYHIGYNFEEEIDIEVPILSIRLTMTDYKGNVTVPILKISNVVFINAEKFVKFKEEK